jgi:hypothetical protein
MSEKILKKENLKLLEEIMHTFQFLQVKVEFITCKYLLNAWIFYLLNE